MADFTSLKDQIVAAIYSNSSQNITGDILQTQLLDMVDAVNGAKQDVIDGYVFGGILRPDDVKTGIPNTQGTLFLAIGAGDYTLNDDTITLVGGSSDIFVITYDEDGTINHEPLVEFDNMPKSGGHNPVTSGGIFSAIESAKGAAGLAEALLDTDSAGAEQEFSLRKSGGDGGAYFRRLLGNTKAFNQMVQNGDFSNGTTNWLASGATLSVADKVLTWTANDAVTSNNLSQNIPITNGHKYFVSFDIKGNANNRLSGALGTVSGGGSFSTENYTTDWKHIATMSSPLTDTSNTLYLHPNSDGAVGAVAYFKNIIVIDLTAMFGAGNEPATPEEFREKYPLLYYAYGRKLIHNKVAKVITKGANQWDEKSLGGKGYSTTTGALVNATNRIASENPIRIFGGAEYYAKFSGTSTLYLLYYDADMNFISYTFKSSSGTFTPPANAAYLHFMTYNDYGEVYKNDICVNISAEINGQYFPYWERELALDITNQEDTDGNKPFAEGMMGAGSAADYANEVGGAKVMGKLDLGTLDWTIGTQGGFIRVTSSEIPEEMKTNQNFVPVNSINAYGFVPSASPLGVNTTNMGMACYNNRLYIRNDAWENKTEEQIKTELSGVILVYEKATPVPFTWKEPLNTGIKVSKYGTEEITPAQTENIDNAPFRAVATYSISIAAIAAALN